MCVMPQQLPPCSSTLNGKAMMIDHLLLESLCPETDHVARLAGLENEGLYPARLVENCDLSCVAVIGSANSTIVQELALEPGQALYVRCIASSAPSAVRSYVSTVDHSSLTAPRKGGYFGYCPALLAREPHVLLTF